MIQKKNIVIIFLAMSYLGGTIQFSSLKLKIYLNNTTLINNSSDSLPKNMFDTIIGVFLKKKDI